MSTTRKTLAAFAACIVVLPAGCKGLEAPTGLWESHPTNGPTVVFDLFARPLPEVPLPNDLATRPDPTSPTGRRVNASMVAPTDFESGTRARLDRLDGWGTFASITVSFEPADQLLDMGNILRRHTHDDFEFADDAVYLIDIDPASPGYGLPVPLDLGEGLYPVNLPQRDRYYENDPRGQTSNIILETVSEDLDGDGVLDTCEDIDHDGETDPGEDLDGDGVASSAERDEDGSGVLDPEEDRNGNGRLDCSEDTDFDGHLDVGNLFCGDDPQGDRIPARECPDVTVETDAGDVVLPADDVWLASFYEMQTSTLAMRPAVPLRERTTYAVVLTRRLVDEQGEAVQSPFPTVHHVDQRAAIEPLEQVLAGHPDIYGGLTIDDVQFAWTFTTQTTTGDIHDIREGLYGRGELGWLAEEFPPEILPDVTHGCSPGSECDLPDNLYVIRARSSGTERGLVDILSDLSEEAFGVDEEDFQTIAAMYESVDYFVHLRFPSPNFLDNDDESEDLDGDGRLDLVDEDLNLDGELGPDEDLDFDGNLDVNEDRNGNLMLDGEEGDFSLDVPQGEAPHGRHLVTALLTVPRADPERGIVPPFPVVVYSHGYTSMRVESLGFAGSLAKYGLATIGVDCAHHGIEVEPAVEELIRAVMTRENLVPMADALLTDRARDMDGDGSDESGRDFWTAYVFHTRDLVRQSAIDYIRLVQIMRSLDGERSWDLDIDGDGETELAGDFNADGIVDIGGPDADYYIMGSSLGGIMSSFLAGLEPAIVAAAPISGGGGLGDVAIRSKQGGVKEAVILRMMGPLVITGPALAYYDLLGCNGDEECPSGEGCVEGMCRCREDRDCAGEAGNRCYDPPLDDPSGERVCALTESTSCGTREVSARFLVPDLNSTGEVEFACLSADELDEGNTVVARNVRNGEVGCFVAWPGGRSRIHLPSDLGDRVELTVYEGDVLLGGETCAVRDDATESRFVDQFEVDASLQQLSWAAGDPLASPAEGNGLRRVTPELRRFIGIAQTVLDPADPANMATHYFLDPIDYGDETSMAAALVIGTVGDQNVPINTGVAIARAAGILDIYEPDPRLADADHPEGVTPNRFLVDHGVLMGLSRITPYRRTSDGAQVLYDADDMDRSGSPPEEGWIGDGLGAPSPPVPLRVFRPLRDGETCTCIDASGEHDCTSARDTVGPLEMVRCEGGVAVLALPYLNIEGEHALNIPNPDAQFDMNLFMINMIGRYFSTQGTEIRWSLCMEDNSCTVEQDGFYTPPGGEGSPD